VLEELDGSFDAFGRSWDLTRGLWRKVLALGGVIYLIYFVAAMALAAPAGIMLATNPAAAQIIGAVSAVLPIVLTPLLPCVFTLMYYDLRVRREAFDLQILGQQLGPA